MDGFLPSDTTSALGYIGVALYLGCYAALQFGLIRGATYLYASLNLIGAGLVLISLMRDFNLFSVIINAVWVLVSLGGIIRLLVLDSSTRFTDEEQRFLTAKLPTLDPRSARRLLNRAVWFDGSAGDPLMVEGHPVSSLIYLANGEATILRGGKPIATCSGGALLGEVTALDGSSATATVVLSKPSRMMRINAATLRDLAADSDVRSALQSSFIVDMRTKLEAVNERIRRGETPDTGVARESAEGRTGVTAKQVRRKRRGKKRATAKSR